MTLSVRNRKPLPFWMTDDSWSLFEWGKGAFMVPSAPIDAIIDFEKWRRTPEGKPYATSGMSDDEFERFLATVGVAHGEASALQLAT